MKNNKVIAAAIIKNNKLLITQRPKDKTLALIWEFPGGKVEKDESNEECIIREIKEELDVTINVHQFIGESSHQYDFANITVYLYKASIKEGKIKLLEHNAMAWISSNEFDKYQFPPLNETLIEEVKEIMEKESNK